MTNLSVFSPSWSIAISRSTRRSATACATRKVREPAFGFPTTTAMLIRSCLSLGSSPTSRYPAAAVDDLGAPGWSCHPDPFEEVGGRTDAPELGRHRVAQCVLGPGP